MKFNDTASSIRIFPGPHYKNNRKQKVRLSEHHHGGGKDLFLDIGEYSSIHSLGFGDKITSVAFIENSGLKSTNPSKAISPSSSTFKKIPVILFAFEHGGLGGAHIVILRNILNIKTRFGNEWNDKISSINILKGPTWDIDNPFNSIWKIKLYKHAFSNSNKHNIPAITISSNDDSRHNSLGGFNDEISGIEILEGG